MKNETYNVLSAQQDWAQRKIIGEYRLRDVIGKITVKADTNPETAGHLMHTGAHTPHSPGGEDMSRFKASESLYFFGYPKVRVGRKHAIAAWLSAWWCWLAADALMVAFIIWCITEGG